MQIIFDKLHRFVLFIFGINKLYMVEAVRWNDFKNHSYVVGVFATKKKAIRASEECVTYRNGKYSCVVYQVELNEYETEDNSYVPVETYRVVGREIG